jgi:hypothetical protein
VRNNYNVLVAQTFYLQSLKQGTTWEKKELVGE